MFHTVWVNKSKLDFCGIFYFPPQQLLTADFVLFDGTSRLDGVIQFIHVGSVKRSVRDGQLSIVFSVGDDSF